MLGWRMCWIASRAARWGQTADMFTWLGAYWVQVLIRWALQHGSSVSPKAGSQEHVQVQPCMLYCLLYLMLCLLCAHI